MQMLSKTEINTNQTKTYFNMFNQDQVYNLSESDLAISFNFKEQYEDNYFEEYYRLRAAHATEIDWADETVLDGNVTRNSTIINYTKS